MKAVIWTTLVILIFEHSLSIYLQINLNFLVENMKFTFYFSPVLQSEGALNISLKSTE